MIQRPLTSRSRVMRRFLNVCSILIFLFSFVPLASAQPPAPRNVYPALWEMAKERPDEMIPVIIQKASRDKRQNQEVDDLVARHGGARIKDLPLIRATAVELPAKAVKALSQAPGVRWISLDAPMLPLASPLDTSHLVSVYVRAVGADRVWNEAPYLQGDGVTVAVVDSGVQGWADLQTKAKTVALAPVQDTQIAQDQQTDFGHSASLMVEREVTNHAHVLLRFDLSSIPPNAVIRDATLTLEKMAGDASADLLHLHPLSRAWTEGNNIAHSGADWTTYDGTSPWTTPGGDAGPAVASATVGAPGPYQWTLTDQVQKWMTGAQPNFGIMVRGETLAGNQPLHIFSSREGATPPRLSVTYTSNTGTNNRILSWVHFSNDAQFLPGDYFGHGSHVAAIIGGNGHLSHGEFMGVAPGVNLVNVKVSNFIGLSRTSDVVKGLEWIYNNKDTYNIRVVNLSLNSAVPESYHTSPLSAAVELLWLNGITVVVSAGNNGTGTGPVPILPPANNPFVITVGATDDRGTADIGDDMLASFSAYGVTSEGYPKPDLVAPGRNIVSLIGKPDALLMQLRPDRLVTSSNESTAHYFRLSGTSMAAPIVTGAAALLLQNEPHLTPDQVKYRLMTTARPFSGPHAGSTGAGYLDIYAAVKGSTTESANVGIPTSQFLGLAEGQTIWNSVNWNSVNWNSVNWNSVNWNSVNWNSVILSSNLWDEVPGTIRPVLDSVDETETRVFLPSIHGN